LTRWIRKLIRFFKSGKRPFEKKYKKKGIIKKKKYFVKKYRSVKANIAKPEK
jgi:hypothetical protein